MAEHGDGGWAHGDGGSALPSAVTACVSQGLFLRNTPELCCHFLG